MNDHTAGVLEGLGYSLRLLRREKHSAASKKIAERILEILECGASDFEFRMRATG